MKKSWVIGVIIILVILIAAYFVFSNSFGSNTGSGTTNSEPNSLVIENFAFSPATLTISVGDTVTWTNRDSVQHTVTSDSGSELDSELLSNGATYSHTFTQAGTYSYHCTPHPSMKGTIVVE